MKQKVVDLKISFFCKILINLRILIIFFLKFFKDIFSFVKENNWPIIYFILIFSIFNVLLFSIFGLEIVFAMIAFLFLPIELGIIIFFFFFLIIPLSAWMSKYELLMFSDIDLENQAKKYFEMFKLKQKILKLDFQLDFEKKRDQFLVIKFSRQGKLGVFLEDGLMSKIPYKVFQKTLKTELEQLVKQESNRLAEIEKTREKAEKKLLLAQQQAAECRKSYPVV